MRLTQRLLLGSLSVLVVLLVAIVLIAGGRLESRLTQQKVDGLARETQFVASQWRAGVDPDALADTAGRALQHRVTLIAPGGAVLGDSEFSREELQRLENHASRPEVEEALRTGRGVARRPSPSAGDEELYVALRTPLGVARVSETEDAVQIAIGGAQRDVLVAGAVGLIGALLLTLLFASSVSRPIVELRDVAQSIASGDLSARPALSAPGEVGDLASALHRMAEQLAARLDALREEEALMTALVESLHQGVVAITERGSVVRINGHARRLFAVEAPPPFPAELLPRHAVVRRAVADALDGRATEPTELQLGERTLALTARPLRRGAVLAILDLTELRRLELVRRDFVANVSHELRTPLTIVRGFSETILEDDELPLEQRRRFLESILTSTVRMQRIVDDLLDLSRIESGRWEPAPALVELAPQVEEVFAAVRRTADARQLRLETRLDAPRATADPTAVRQVLGNLVENAVRYTSEGTITVSSEPSADGVTLRVRDTGVGIPAEHLERVFERFYRVDPARSREAGGTGLGLAIVKHLVEAHGGRVRAESEPGRGTVVSVFFPGRST